MHHALYDFLRDQGSIIAGVFALIAGVIAYKAGIVQANATRHAAEQQAKAERRRHDEEVDTVRKSLAIELRQHVGRAFGAHLSLKRLIMQSESPITARMVEDSAGLPVLIVYPAVADRIGMLHGEAMDIVIVYNLIEIARNAVSRMTGYRTPDDIPRANVAVIAEAFLGSCLYARGVLPRLRTGVALHDSKDEELLNRITEAESAWERLLSDMRGSQDGGARTTR